MLPLPFCRGVILWGEPIPVPRRAEAEALAGRRRELERRLNGLTAEAGGRTRVELRNDHLQYALTWYALAVVLVVIYLLFHRRAPAAPRAG